VSRGARGILEIFEIALNLFLLKFRRLDLVQFVHGHCDRARLAQNRDFEKTRVDGVGEIGNLFELLAKLSISRDSRF
jgi:hypothetical protein